MFWNHTIFSIFNTKLRNLLVVHFSKQQLERVNLPRWSCKSKKFVIFSYVFRTVHIIIRCWHLLKLFSNRRFWFSNHTIKKFKTFTREARLGFGCASSISLTHLPCSVNFQRALIIRYMYAKHSTQRVYCKETCINFEEFRFFLAPNPKWTFISHAIAGFQLTDVIEN